MDDRTTNLETRLDEVGRGWSAAGTPAAPGFLGAVRRRRRAQRIRGAGAGVLALLIVAGSGWIALRAREPAVPVDHRQAAEVPEPGRYAARPKPTPSPTLAYLTSLNRGMSGDDPVLPESVGQRPGERVVRLLDSRDPRVLNAALGGL